MRILADTHILIWSLGGFENMLPKAARDILLSPENSIYFSMVNIWEIAIKHMAHPDDMKYDAKIFVDLCLKAGYHPIEGKISHIFAFETLTRPEDAPKHKDPFDRLLLAQAKSEGMMFLTHDGLISYYNEPCIISV